MVFIPAMHIPDGFLSPPVWLLGWALAIIMIGFAVRQTRDVFGERQVPLMGILAAFIFAAQMINFPVAGGTSGHLLGGALAAIILGPWAAVLIMTSVVAIQAAVFLDGGLLALGFNIFNMGIITAFVGYALYRWTRRMLPASRTGMAISAFIAAWCSVEAAAVATSLQLAASGTSPLGVALPAMVGVHALVGIGEGLITAAALLFIAQTRPDLIGTEAAGKAATAGSSWIAIGLVLALAVVLVSPLASPEPDGLERVALDAAEVGQFTPPAAADPEDPVAGAEPPYATPLTDYRAIFIENEALATIAAGAIGTVLVAGAAFAVARLRRRVPGAQGQGR